MMGAALALPAMTASAPAGATVAPPFQAPVLTPDHVCTSDNFDSDLCTTITVTKTDSVTGLPVSGAVFTLHNADGSCDTQDVIETSTPGSTAGTYTFEVPADENALYCVNETTAPPGYTLNTTTKFVAVVDDIDGTEGSPNTCPVLDGPSSVKAGSVGGDVATITDQSCVSPVTFANDPIPVRIDISKYGTNNTGLNGATFTLQNKDGSAVTTGPTGQVNGSPSCATAGGTSSAAATCSILNIQIAGTYQLAETTAPSGYNTVPPIPVTVTLGTPPIQVIVTDTAIVVPPTAPASSSTAAVTGATTVHTGEPFAGSAPYALLAVGAGATLLGVGILRRRRVGSTS